MFMHNELHTAESQIPYCISH